MRVQDTECFEAVAVKYGQNNYTCELLENESKILNMLTYYQHTSAVRSPVNDKGFPNLKEQYTNLTNSKRGKCRMAEEYLPESATMSEIRQKIDNEKRRYPMNIYQDHHFNVYLSHLMLLTKWINQIINTVRYMHQLQIIYCDWNMMNILISDENANAYVIDFGNSVLVDNDTVVDDEKVEFVATYSFAAPVLYEKLYDIGTRISHYGPDIEQLWHDAKFSDYYAIASLFLEMYMGVKYGFHQYYDSMERYSSEVVEVMKIFQQKNKLREIPTSDELRLLDQYRQEIIAREWKNLNHIQHETQLLQILSDILINGDTGDMEAPHHDQLQVPQQTNKMSMYDSPQPAFRAIIRSVY